MNAIDKMFQRLRSAGQKAFIPFIPAGDPTINATATLTRALNNSGAHLIEIGFPFSDPIADGPVIQAAYTRVLNQGLHVDDVLNCIASLAAGAEKVSAPVAGMVSFSLIYRRGIVSFLDEASRSGISGLIVPDLPIEEAGELFDRATERDICLVQLVTPTTPPDRAERIVTRSRGFVYVVSVAGITGERTSLPDELVGQLRRLRSMTSLPLCVGFGVSRPEQAAMLREIADGVIVGSAIVRRLEKATAGNWDAVVVEIETLVRSFVAALNPAETRS
jgi:tryptophan synthase alpha chain